jgi:hypothetical protein
MTTGTVRAPDDRVDFAARFVVRAALTAPSMHNAQPWSFASSRDVISLYADPARPLPPTDPTGREMVISGGTALFNLRLAMRHLGFAGQVRLLPRGDRLDHLAEVRWGPYSRPTACEELLYGAMTRRRTHRGRFTVNHVPATLITDMGRLARDERAALHVVGGAQIRVLDELVGMAEMAERTERGIAAERARRPAAMSVGIYDGSSAARNGDRAADGPADGSADGWRLAESTDDHGLGVVAVLATYGDRPLDWLLAGQVLQRLLLHAAAHDVSAAFHPRPLALPEYRRRIQTEFAGGAYPQVLLRLGHTARDAETTRRPMAGALLKER